tara:strand:- start:45799 stop:46677 length:879 start_codon:yes stop_codon:yes gene_type:complete
MSENYEHEGQPRERSTYSAFGDEYRGFDAREEETGGKGPLVIALAAGVVLVFGTVVWNAYRQGTKTGPGDTPVFTADRTPYKIKPEGSGTLQKASSGRLFEEDGAGSTEKLIPAAATERGTAQGAGARSDGKPRDLRPIQAVEAEERRTPEIKKRPDPAPQPVVEEPTQQEAALRPQVAEPRPLPPMEAEVAPAPASVKQAANGRFDPNGEFLVQVMALRDLTATEKAWAQLTEANSDLFAGAEMDIQRADLGAKGIFYRLRASAFASRGAADEFCSQLKSRGQSCIVIARS